MNCTPPPRTARLTDSGTFYLLCYGRVVTFGAVCFNPFTTENPFLGTKLLGFNVGRGSGALKGLTGSGPLARSDSDFAFLVSAFGAFT